MDFLKCEHKIWIFSKRNCCNNIFACKDCGKITKLEITPEQSLRLQDEVIEVNGKAEFYRRGDRRR
jgi:hypothetical protein